MPGPVSDSYDPEWGTGTNVNRICDALVEVYRRLGDVLGRQPPLHILDLLDSDLPKPITATLSEREWRLLRFAAERALDSI